MRQRIKLHIRGIVQGVGFRPHVFRLSRKFNLSGCVFNDLRGVTIELEGESGRIKDFVRTLKKSAPKISSINRIKEKRIPLTGTKGFSIIESRLGKNRIASFPSDIAICSNCKRELFDESDRRYLYPFINCTDCGPRFSIIEDIPYDRKKTTMRNFKMCGSCLKEYKNPLDRRFHAEPDACFSCGPHIRLLKKLKEITPVLDTQEILQKASCLIKGGKIIAIKGIGGYHLACDAKNAKAVSRLRKLKNRPTKPFAVMVENISALSGVCVAQGAEKKLLACPSRPITLLRIKDKKPWINEVCPEQNFLGAMLCYAPLHYLLFYYLKQFEKFPVLVMTSGNKGDLPLVASEDELCQIEEYADFFLVHNRRIHVKCDDSIARIFNGKEIIIRKARGYTPDFVNFAHKKEILACGAELKSTFSIAAGGHLVNSPYLGDLKNYANYELYLKTLSHYKKILDVAPQVVAHDLHPSYMSSQYALSLKNVKKITVQHHHAHLASCLFENNINKRAIGICFDGAGLGKDDAIWGGEFFITDKKNYQRAGHFKYFGLLGADKAVEEPARIAFSMLYDIFGEKLFKLNLNCLDYFKRAEKNIFCNLIKDKETVRSSSAGRLFDAAASLLNLKHKISYEAEAAVSLEMLAGRAKTSDCAYGFSISRENGIYIVSWQDIFSEIVRDLKTKKDKAAIAYKFHFTMAKIIKEVSLLLRRDTGINNIALSGGVFQNFLLLNLTLKLFKGKGFNVYYHKRIPTNDSGVSIGQAVVANENI
ncbi:MAG: carbamoyltransferase HypF [Candidatus Omnitrophica bacterium]|nr:carbamoyltransferase HypF [Candidatus Omnitrophota bacterium]